MPLGSIIGKPKRLREEQTMSRQEAERILKSPATHYVVHDILALLKDKDPVDSRHNLMLCHEIIKATRG